MIYLAAPYTHKHDYIVNLRSLLVSQITLHLMNNTNNHYYSPISHGHYIEQSSGSPSVPYSKWMAHGLKILSHCEKMIVCDFYGADESNGIELEIEYCHANNIPVEYLSIDKIKNMPEVSRHLLNSLAKFQEEK